MCMCLNIHENKYVHKNPVPTYNRINLKIEGKMKIFRKIKYQVLALVSLLVIFQIILSVSAYLSLSSVNSNLNLVFSKRLPSIDNLVQADRDFQQSLVAERTLLHDVIEEKDKLSLIDDYKKNRQQVIDRFGVYEKLASTPEEKEIIAKFHKNYKQWKDYSDSNLKFLTAEYKGKRSLYLEKSLKEASRYFESSRDNMDKLQELILNFADAEFRSAEKTYESALLKMLISLVVGVILSVGLSFLIIKNITAKISNAVNQINENASELNNISNNLATKSSELSAIAQEQSASVDETSSSLHEISEMVKKNTEIAVGSADRVNNGKNQLRDSLNLILKLAERIKDVNQSSQSLGKSVDENHERLTNILTVFNEIQNKTSVINDIVFQTKLLSFNASVESARAGEHGKGFAVVAEEIGGLAQQSGQSANEISSELENSFSSISGIIERSKQEVYKAVKDSNSLIEECLSLSQECETVLNAMSNMFEEISSSSNEIAGASQEQSAGVGEINSAVQEISTSNQVTSQRSTEVEQLSQGVGNVSTTLGHSIQELQKII